MFLSTIFGLTPFAAVLCFVGAVAQRRYRPLLIALGILLLAPMAFVIFLFWSLAHTSGKWG
jgi:hypothetical protein